MIQTAKQRKKLTPRRNPYFVKLDKGRHLGFRRTVEGGSWIARHYDEATQSYTYQALGEFAGVPGDEAFGAAAKEAAKFFAHLDGGGAKETATVAQACEAYIVDKPKDEQGNMTAATRADLGRLRRFVLGEPAQGIKPDPIASIDVRKLTATHLRQWRQRVADTKTIPAKRGARCRVKTAPKVRVRSPATVNRDIMPLRSALNMAFKDGTVTSDAAWRDTLADDGQKGERKTLFLTREQCAALHAEAAKESRKFAALVRALNLIPIRPGALAHAQVRDLSACLPDGSVNLYIRKDKTKKATGRTVNLPPHVAKHFADQCKSKTPAALIFDCEDGSQWNKDKWKKLFAKAVAKAGLVGATVLSLRHAAISELVLLGLDWNSLGNLAGTSAQMIQDNYAQLRPSAMHAALRKIAC